MCVCWCVTHADSPRYAETYSYMGCYTFSQTDTLNGACTCNMFQSEEDTYGVDWEGPTSGSQETERVEVPDTPFPDGFSLQDLQHIDPLADSSEYGIDLYLNVLNIVTSQQQKKLVIAKNELASYVGVIIIDEVFKPVQKTPVN